MAGNNRIVLTGEVLAELRGHIDRTLVGPHLLLKSCGDDVPEGLSRPTIENWLYERCKTARKEYVEYVLTKWRSLPDGDRAAPFIKPKDKLRPGYVVITSEVRVLLQKHRRKGYIPSRLLKCYDDIPNGLQPSIISTWVTGSAMTARKNYLDYVIAKCEELDSQA